MLRRDVATAYGVGKGIPNFRQDPHYVAKSAGRYFIERRTSASIDRPPIFLKFIHLSRIGTRLALQTIRVYVESDRSTIIIRRMSIYKLKIGIIL